MKKTVRLEMEFEVEIPDKEIPSMLKDYQKTITPGADVDDLFSQVVWGDLNGWSFVEGIGDLDKLGIEVEEIDREWEVS